MRLPWRRENPEKAPDIPWFWTLTIDGMPAANFDWPDILQGLEGLRADPDSFLALERQNPACIQESGFLQCAVVLTGERAGWYAVECGYPGPEGPVLLERQVPSIQEVVPVFESVYRQRDAVLSGFADLSDAMGRNESTR